jgi:hypothetical protein
MRSAAIGVVLTGAVLASSPFAQEALPPGPGGAAGAEAPAAGAPGPRHGGPPMPPPPSPESVSRAAEILRATRQAIGGDKLAGVKTIVASGRTRRVRGNNLVPIEFQVDLELPDKFVRRDESPAEETDPTSTGFNGSELIQLPVASIAPPTRAGGAPPTPVQLEAQRTARLNAVRHDFVRFAIGMFADTFTAFPLTFSFAAQAEAPQGKAEVLNVTGAGGLNLRFFINSETKLPIMLSWSSPPTNVIVTAPGQPPPQTVAPGAVVVAGPAAPPATATAEEKAAHAREVQAVRQKAQATPVENRIYYADYREVEGLRLPFRLRRAIGADTTEETSFDRFRINVAIPPQRFAVPK